MSCEEEKNCNMNEGVNNEPHQPKRLKFENISDEQDDLHQSNENKNNDIQYIDSPIKLDTDTDLKEYRTIKLKNGFTALLISLSKNTNNKNYKHKNANDGINNSFQDQGDSVENQFDVKKHENENKVNNVEDENDSIENQSVLKEDANEDNIAFCSLCINVGSFCDPPNVTGLAHLLEHTLTMGTKKYPKDNDYNSFFSKKLGISSSLTESEKTIYSFQISDLYLLEAMDRFAHLFIDPLITKDAISRECQAVDNEFKIAKQVDSHRKVQLKRSLLKKAHPATKLPWGNSETLCDNITLDELQTELNKFRNRHYSAHRMTFVVHASLPLDELEQYVKKCFLDVPSNNLPPYDFSSHTGVDNSFDMSRFKRFYKIQTIKDFHEIEFNWLMPPMNNLYRSKPWEYISFLLSRDGEGSLYNCLKKKKWCHNVYNGSCKEFERTSMYFIFSLTFILTDEGYKHLNKITALTFSYINFLKKKAVQKSLFEYIKKRKEENFWFETHNTDKQIVEQISQNMQYCSPTDYLYGHYLIFEYNHEFIKNCVGFLTPENVNIIISSKDVEQRTLNFTDYWFCTRYSSYLISEDIISYWKKLQPHPEFSLKINNNFREPLSRSNNNIDFIEASPIELRKDKFVEFWFKKQSKQNSDISLFLHLVGAIGYESPLHSSLLNLLVIVFNYVSEKHKTKETKISFSDTGLILKSSGTEREELVTVIYRLILDLICCHKLVTENIFNAAKKEVLRMFYNNFIDPEKLNLEIFFSLTASVFWLSNDKFNALRKVTYEQFLNYALNFPKQVFIQSFIVGYFTNKEALACITDCVRPLFGASALSIVFPSRKTYKFKYGNRCCQIQNFNPSDNNSVVANYYQIDVASQKLYAIFSFLEVLMEEPLSYKLKMQEQLGYKIACKLQYIYNIVSFAITITSPANKFTGEYIDERIKKFVHHYKDSLEKMSSDEFECMKDNFIKSRIRHQLEVSSDMEKVWSEMVKEEYFFENQREQIIIIRNLTIDDICDAINEYMTDGLQYKNLTVQVVGTRKASKTDLVDMPKDKNFKYIYSPEIPQDTMEDLDYYYINDVIAFRRELKKYTEKLICVHL